MTQFAFSYGDATAGASPWLYRMIDAQRRNGVLAGVNWFSSGPVTLSPIFKTFWLDARGGMS